MGKRGPPPTPTPILKLRGSWRADQNRDEPQPEPGPPEKPDWLDDYASQAWDQLVPILERMRVLTEADGKALALLCTTWARWRRCEEFVAANGEVYTIRDPDGKARELRRFPQALASESLGRSLNRYLGEFGAQPFVADAHPRDPAAAPPGRGRRARGQVLQQPLSRLRQPSPTDLDGRHGAVEFGQLLGREASNPIEETAAPGAMMPRRLHIKGVGASPRCRPGSA